MFYFELHLLGIFLIESLKIMFKWSLPLTSMKFYTLSNFFNTSAAVIFLSSSSSATISGSSSNWLAALAVIRTCSVKLVEVTGKRVNCDFGLGLGIQVNVFLWRCKSYNMYENSLEKLDNELHVKVKKCVKQKHSCVFYFPNQS